MPDALNVLNASVTTQPWATIYRDALPQLGVPGGGDIATVGTTSPARGKLQAKTGTAPAGRRALRPACSWPAASAGTSSGRAAAST